LGVPRPRVQFSSSWGRSFVADLTVSVAEILGRPGAYRDFRVSGSLEGAGVALAQLEADSLAAELRAESVIEGVLITGRVQGTTVLTCARCLKDFRAPVEVEVCELFAGPGHEEDDPDAYRVGGPDLHLEPMLRDVVTLALPLNPHCAEGCVGLCPRCGRELGNCSCEVEERDPRWAGLDALRERLS